MLVLASDSPRRRQLLAMGGWKFSVVAPRVDEHLLPGELPRDYVRRLAESKARAAFRLLDSPVPPGMIIIAADTAVVDTIGDEKEKVDHVGAGRSILGKPADAIEAEKMLRRLRGRLHQVFTTVVVMDVGGGLLGDVCVTDVPMRDYSDDEISHYVSSGDPLDKAGAYAIQHAGFKPVENLSGCYANVMGLPICHLARLLARLGVNPEAEIWLACKRTLGYTCPIVHQVLDEGGMLG